MTRWAVLIAALLAAGSAEAQCLGFQCPPGVLGAGASGGAAVPPLDGFPVPTGAYSFRKLTQTATLSARIRRASDSAPLDVGFLGFVPGIGAPWNEAAAASHCAATSCFLVTWYDQTGAGRDWTQGTGGNQIPIVFGCQNFIACLETTVATHSVTLAGFTPATGLMTLSAVGNRTSGTGQCAFIRANNNPDRLTGAPAAANQWAIATLTAAAADNVWHAATGVLSTVAGQSVLNIDGVETTGTTTPTTVAGNVGVLGATTTTCRQTEAVFWDNAALTAPQRAAWVANQRSFWVP
jgi:hypothetical protein